MAPGDLDPRLFTGKWRLSLADYFLPKRKAPVPRPETDASRASTPDKCGPRGCRA